MRKSFNTKFITKRMLDKKTKNVEVIGVSMNMGGCSEHEHGIHSIESAFRIIKYYDKVEGRMIVPHEYTMTDSSNLPKTNETGNLLHLEHFDLKFHGTGDSATSEIREVASRIVNYALLTGKDIVIEDLDFRKTKSETDEAKSEDGKEYNKMIHAFDYSRYKKSFENCCFRSDVNLMEVNPDYTSKIAKQKYCDRKKLVIHQGASFVIARKGQGYVDKYIKPKKRKTKKSA